MATAFGALSGAARPRLHAYDGPGAVAARVLDSCTALKTPFVPTPWALNGHAQSAMGVLRTLTAKGTYTRQPVLADDGGTLGLDWWNGADRPSYGPLDAPVALFIHGINGGSHEGYVKWACAAAAARGWRAVVLNLRGCNGLGVSSPRGYSALMTHDVHVALASAARRFPRAPLFAVGYSLGSVLLAKYIAEADAGLHGPSPGLAGAAEAAEAGGGGNVAFGSSGGGGDFGGGGGGGGASGGANSGSGSKWAGIVSGSGLVAAALMSPPVCLHCCNAKLARVSPDILYNFAVAYKLREYVREHLPSLAAHGTQLDAAALDAVGWTVGSFDDAVTLKQLGYRDGDDYYRHACTTNYLPHIRTPTLILASRDDPFLGYVPTAEAKANPFLALALTKRGGHLGFLHGGWPLGPSYADAAVDDWLACALREAAADGGGGGGSWVQRAVSGGWQPPPEPAGGLAVSLANARCDCLERTLPELATAAAAAKSGAAGVGGAAAGGAGLSMAGGEARGKAASAAAGGGDGRWRLDDVLSRPPSAAATRRVLGLWSGFGGGGGSGSRNAGAGEGSSGGSAGGSGRSVAVPSATLEVPSPTLDRRPHPQHQHHQKQLLGGAGSGGSAGASAARPEPLRRSRL